MTSEWREWDYPPDRHRRSLPQMVDFDGDAQATSRPFTIERRSGYARPQRPLSARIWSAYANVMWQLGKLIVATVLTAVVIAAFSLIAIILKH
jgi:hypothetical protein